MMSSSEMAIARLRTALSMFTTGVQVMEQNLRRRMPGATAAEIQQALQRWLRERPGAEAGDAIGRSIPWPRSRG